MRAQRGLGRLPSSISKTIERTFPMKMLAALLLGCCLVSGGVARAEKIDFSTTTCKQFMEGHKDSIGVVLAWLDGPDADSGTCFEAGYAFAKGIPVIGIRTDFRDNQERGVNIMLSRACAAFVYRPSFAEDMEGLAKEVARILQRMLHK